MEITITVHTVYNTYIKFTLSNDTSIGYLKSYIQDKIGVHPDCIYLFYNNVFLENDYKNLYDYNINNDDIIIQRDRIPCSV